MHGASKDEAIRNTLQDGTRMLQGDEQDPLPATRPGHRSENGSKLGGESIRGGGAMIHHLRTLSRRKPQICSIISQVVSLTIFLCRSFGMPRVTRTRVLAGTSQSTLKDPRRGKTLNGAPVL